MLAFLDFINLRLWRIDSSIPTSELFPESFLYCVNRKDRDLNGGVIMLLVHKDNNSRVSWGKKKRQIRQLTLRLAGVDHLPMAIYQYRTTEMID